MTKPIRLKTVHFSPIVMSVNKLRELISKLFQHVFEQNHMDAWFKWLGWVTATAAIGSVWWQTQNHIVLPLVIISFAYIWVAAHQGLCVFTYPMFTGWRWGRSSGMAVAYLISISFTLVAFLTLGSLFIGLFHSLN